VTLDRKAVGLGYDSAGIYLLVVLASFSTSNCISKTRPCKDGKGRKVGFTSNLPVQGLDLLKVAAITKTDQ